MQAPNIVFTSNDTNYMFHCSFRFPPKQICVYIDNWIV